MRILVAAIVTLAVAGCEKRDIPGPTLAAIDGADQYELLSLDPSHPEDVPPEHFHAWRVLGRTSISDVTTRKELNDALRAGAHGSDGSAAACFAPRHGIHVVRSGQVTDVVICFECNRAQVFDDGKKGAGFLTTSSPEEKFDSVLKDAGVPLAEKSK